MTNKKNRKILFISRAYGENAGGMERLSFELIHSFEGEGNSAIVHEAKRGGSLFSARLSSLFFVCSVLPRALVASKDADIVHLGDPVLSLIGWCIARVRNIPIVVTVHGLDVSYSHPLYQQYLRLFFRNFTAYVAISEYAKRLVEEKNVTGTISVIPPALHDRLYDPSKTRSDLANMLKRDIANTVVLATTGRLVKRKGHAWFIENVIPKLPEHVLYAIAGDGPERDAIAAIIERKGLQKKVVMLGRISDEDQRILLNTIDAFIQPNIFVAGDGEGFGIAPLEAALCGRVVIASNSDGIPSAIHNDKNGILLPAEDAEAWISVVSQFIQTPEKNLVFGTSAREYTKVNFTWESVKRQYEEILIGR